MQLWSLFVCNPVTGVGGFFSNDRREREIVLVVSANKINIYKWSRRLLKEQGNNPKRGDGYHFIIIINMLLTLYADKMLNEMPFPLKMIRVHTYKQE